MNSTANANLLDSRQQVRGTHTFRWLALAPLVVICFFSSSTVVAAEFGAGKSFAQTISDAQPKMVKVFGSGGLRSLESYQSGFLISADGFVLTSWSYVLDTGKATVILNDGRKFEAEVVGADPRTEIAVLKVDAQDLAHFSLGHSPRLTPGARVLAFGNVYGVATGDEPTSVLHGIVAGITRLSARRGAFETPFRGDVYVLDAMTNNAGAAGGALTDAEGNLAGALGKELRDSQTNIWLNYAVPIDELRSAIEAILTGAPAPDAPQNKLPEQFVSLRQRGVALIPNVLLKTPPYIDEVQPDSPAARAGLAADDLIVLVEGRTVISQAAVTQELREIDAVDSVRITVMRGTELIDTQLAPK